MLASALLQLGIDALDNCCRTTLNLQTDLFDSRQLTTTSSVTLSGCDVVVGSTGSQAYVLNAEVDGQVELLDVDGGCGARRLTEVVDRGRT